MHRALCRAIRGSCRKWRESDVPVVAGEEVRKNQDKKEKFVPPGHTFNEAIGWGSFLILAYELGHKKKYLFKSSVSSDEDVPENLGNSSSSFKKCPIALISLVSQALNQPILYSSSAKFINNSSNVESTTRHNHHSSRSTVLKRSSIDTSPFLPESFLTFSDSGSDIDDDDSIFFEDNSESVKTPSNQVTAELSKPADPATAAAAKQVSGDILSVYGAVKFLLGKKFQRSTPTSSSTETMSDPPLSALELMQKGAEWGSGKSLYNLGVAYDRLKEMDLAQEYYQRAFDISGHPLAAYNLAVYYLKDVAKSTEEGMTLMRYAEQNGVPEARDFFRDLR